MEPKFQTSFIPKSPVLSTGLNSNKEHSYNSSVSLISIVSIVMLIAVAISSVGLFLYNQMQSKAIVELKEALALEKSAFNESETKDLILVSDQIKVVKSLLDQHLILSNIFAVMQSATIQNINFTEIAFDTKNEGVVEVDFKGRSSSYEHIAKQAELFKSTGFLKNVLFYNMEIDKDGNLVFDGSMSVLVNDTSYKEILKKLSLSN